MSNLYDPSTNTQRNNVRSQPNTGSDCLAGCARGYHEFIRELKDLWTDVTSTMHENVGTIKNVERIEGSNDLDKCHHYVELDDGFKYRLIFPNRSFSELEDKLIIGQKIKLIYRMPSYNVVNIYPMRKTNVRFMSMTDLISEENCFDDTNPIVKVTYIDDELKRIDIIEPTIRMDDLPV
jgi:hypothetical protein